MFGIKFGSGSDTTLAALHKSLGIIEFDRAGNILAANANYCRMVGYTLEEIKGKHHRIFVEVNVAQSEEYKAFWEMLGRGESHAKEYKRIGKDGRELWIDASYNSAMASDGTVAKIVKVATDVTVSKLRNAELDGKIDAISRAQGIIEFKPDGRVITANENFLAVVGYRLDEIQGKHHCMFVDEFYAKSRDYEEFWQRLNAGEFVSSEFVRVGKGGKPVWIRASYNPVLDLNNQVVKVVKFATDLSDWGYALKEIGTGLLNLADNNLEYRLETVFHSAFEELRCNFNSSLEKLQRSMQQIEAGAKAIHTGAQEITTASDDLSRRTENQAANLEETAGALNQITSTVKAAANGAARAQQVVAAADEDAKQSALVVGQTVEAMAAIAKSAQNISQIIGVIDEIAFQTNLLALNAGVEAARAGDSGRGFAVVASEVRALAQRSAAAAKEITGLISTSTREVEHGVKLVAATGMALDRILKQVNEINTVVADISAGAKDQAGGLSEINAAITQMDQVTQQNAAMVEETTAASHALSSEAIALADLIGQFKTGRAAIDRRRDKQKTTPISGGSSNLKLCPDTEFVSKRARP